MTALWISASLLTVATLFLVLGPLLRRSARPEPRRAYDLTVFRDQLDEVNRDQVRGLLEPEQAEAARTEIKRRMLAAADDERAGPSKGRPARRSPAMAVLLGLAVPVAAFALYLKLGAPDVPDQPLAERVDRERTVARAPAPDLAEAIARLRARLEEQADNLDGWLLLGRSYVSLERYGEAAEAFRRALDLSEGRADVAADYGEAVVAAADGRVTPEASEAFEATLQREPRNVKARYYLALGRAQAGDLQTALTGWQNLIEDASEDTPWAPLVREQINRAAAELGVDPSPAAVEPEATAENTDQAPGPTREDIEAAAGMSDSDREAMIHAMVERLAIRLEEEPGDREGWLRLARAYEVLGEPDKARAARARAQALRKDDGAAGDPRSGPVGNGAAPATN